MLSRFKKCKQIFIPIIFFTFLSSFTLICVYIINIFAIKKVVIISDRFPIKGLERLQKTNNLVLNTKKISEGILQNNSNIKEVFIKKIYPSGLVIDLILKKPKAILSNPQNKLLIDEEGFLLDNIDSSDWKLPTIESNYVSFKSTQQVDWRIYKTLSFIKYFEMLGLSINKIIIEEKNNTFEIILDTTEKVITSYNIDPAKLAASLQLIISRFRIEGKIIDKIDFQFDKPIVILKNGDKTSSF